MRRGAWSLLICLVASWPGWADDPYQESEEERIDPDAEEYRESLREIHDPSRLLAVDGVLYVFFSGFDGSGIGVRSLRPGEPGWEEEPPLFEEGSDLPWLDALQPWNRSGEFDAPSFADRDNVYFTVFDEEGDRIQDAIVRVQNRGSFDDPEWSEGEIILRSRGEEDEQPRAMDPSFFRTPDGRQFMVFGSHAGGIYVTALDPRTGRLLEHPEDTWCDERTRFPDRFVRVATNELDDEEDQFGIEAPFILYHQGWYYLFVNWGRCCSGLRSTYTIRVGRSRDPDGEYRTREGQRMTEGGGAVLLRSEGRFIGPGHAGVYRYEEAGRERLAFTFHYYDRENEGEPALEIRELSFDPRGWPVVSDAPLVPFARSERRRRGR